MPELSDGTMIDDRYHVLSRLGTGGMAEVYLAEDQQLGRKVALKLLHRRFSEDPDFVERFRREAQSAAGLQHPNVVSVYDRGAYDGTYYIAMEYLAGPSLKQLIRQDAPMEPLRAIDITIQILKAARFAHRRGIIHRDLKPHNVIVGDGDHAKVTDFGIARAGASDMTETGSIMGTSQYLSPEQAQGHAVSPTSDLYAVGVILYEMVTGRVPFDAESAVTIAIKHVSEAPVAPTQINPSVPPELEQVILWALNKNPADRPADADAFISALEAVKVNLTEGSPSERTASFTALPAGAGVVAAAAVAPDGEAALLAAEGEEPPPEEPASAGGRRWLWALVAVLLLAGVALGAYLLTRPATKAVPTVVGEKVSVAQTQIQNAGFTPNLIYRTDTGPAGTVIAQQPLGNTSVKAGSMVTLTVSQGPGNTTVPSVSGLSAPHANRTLRRAHLKVGRTETASSADVPAGEATRTDPPSGTSLPVGSAVTLFVSSGQPQTQTQKTVPDVTGQPQAAAEAQLGRAGFKVTTSTRDSSSVPAGNVISQSPSGGSTANPGSTVSLVVASAPATVKVPDVKGDTADAASGNLTGAGFNVTKKFQDVSRQSRDGIVISQSPGAGSTAGKGSTVTIVVGRFSATTTTTTKPRTTTTGPTTTTTTT